MSPRKRANRTPELANLPPVEPEIPAGFTTLSPTEERRELELEEILGQLGTDARIKVWQIIDGKASYAGDMSADGFSLDALLDAFGGGDKTLHIMQGKTRVEKVTVSLDPSIPPKNPRMPKGIVSQAAPGALDSNSLMVMMAKSQIDNAQAMTTMITGMVGAMATMMGATRSNVDPVAQAVQIANVLKPAGGGTGSISEAMALLREGIKLGESMGGKEDDGVMGIVGKGMDTLALLVDGIVTKQKSEAAARRLPGAPVATVDAGGVAVDNGGPVHSDTPSQAAGESTVSLPLWATSVRPYIGQLFGAASFMKPDAAAQVIADKLSDEEFYDLIDDIQDQDNGGFGARLKEYFPNEVQSANAEWIGQVIHVLLTEHVEVDDTAAPPGDAGSN